jgi:hypothetical protein
MAENSRQDRRSVARKSHRNHVRVHQSRRSVECRDRSPGRSIGRDCASASDELVVRGVLERTLHRHYRVGPNLHAIVASTSVPAGETLRMTHDDHRAGHMPAVTCDDHNLAAHRTARGFCQQRGGKHGSQQAATLGRPGGGAHVKGYLDRPVSIGCGTVTLHYRTSCMQ